MLSKLKMLVQVNQFKGLSVAQKMTFITVSNVAYKVAIKQN